CGASLDRVFDGGVCPDCWSALERPPAARCRICDEPMPGEPDLVCGRCLVTPPPFSSLRAAAPYRGTAREILLAFKFSGADYLARHLAARMAGRLERPDGVHEIAAVPPGRRKRRGSEHAASALAAAVAERLDLPFAPRRLVKIRETDRQSGLPL